jgi:hypothetical protein
MPSRPRDRRLVSQNTLTRRPFRAGVGSNQEKETYARKVDLPQSESPRSKIVTVGASSMQLKMG